jgi:hypothetical protein
MFPLICPLLLPPKFNPHIVSFEKVITAGIARTHSTKIRFFFSAENQIPPCVQGASRLRSPGNHHPWEEPLHS